MSPTQFADDLRSASRSCLSRVFFAVVASFVLLEAVVAGAQTITEFTIPTTDSHPEGITVGPDGALWFTEFSGQKIGRVTTAGFFTEFPVPPSFPSGITAGPDGALWFTESGLGFGSEHVIRMTTAGGLVGYLPPTAASGP